MKTTQQQTLNDFFVQKKAAAAAAAKSVSKTASKQGPSPVIDLLSSDEDSVSSSSPPPSKKPKGNPKPRSRADFNTLGNDEIIDYLWKKERRFLIHRKSPPKGSTAYKFRPEMYKGMPGWDVFDGLLFVPPSSFSRGGIDQRIKARGRGSKNVQGKRGVTMIHKWYCFLDSQGRKPPIKATGRNDPDDKYGNEATILEEAVLRPKSNNNNKKK